MKYKWKGLGYCKNQHIRKHDDFCNMPIARKSEFCLLCLCQVNRCKNKWTCWNMAYGKFCNKHYPSILKNQEPDDFDIPDC